LSSGIVNSNRQVTVKVWMI